MSKTLAEVEAALDEANARLVTLKRDEADADEYLRSMDKSRRLAPVGHEIRRWRSRQVDAAKRLYDLSDQITRKREEIWRLTTELPNL